MWFESTHKAHPCWRRARDVLAIGAVLLTVGPNVRAQQAPRSDRDSKHSENSFTLVVTGQGEVDARPDTAKVRVGVEAEAESATLAQEAVNTSMQKTLRGIEKLGIAKRAIQTVGLNLSPVYAPPKPGQEIEPPRIVGYRAGNTIQVEVNDLAQVGKVIDAGLAGGANRLQGLVFGLQKESAYRMKALEKAAEEAQAKARTLAKALGVKLISVRRVQESGISVHPPRFAPLLARAGATATPVEPGQLKITASVSVTYDIAPGGLPAKSK